MEASPDTWCPEQYERFQRERSQPFFDLMALVRKKPDLRVADLGCGTGELTERLHTELGARETLGLDSSDAMLEKAALRRRAGLGFEKGDIATFAATFSATLAATFAATFAPAEPFDLLFSNAALHWLPDHEGLLTGLTRALAPDGQLAVQVPANHDHPSHRAAEDVAAEEPFSEPLNGWVHPHNVLSPQAYAVLLDRLGYREQSVFVRVYGHHLASREEVVEWFKGSLLTAYEARLPVDLFPLFLERYRVRLVGQLENTRPYFFTFNRILIWAAR